MSLEVQCSPCSPSSSTNTCTCDEEGGMIGKVYAQLSGCTMADQNGMSMSRRDDRGRVFCGSFGSMYVKMPKFYLLTLC